MNDSGSGSGSGSGPGPALEEASCYPALHIAQEDIQRVGKRLSMGQYDQNNISLALNNLTGDSLSYIFPSATLDTSDTRSEKIHTYDSAALLTIMALLFLTVITIWLFKVKRFRILHETGLSLIYGVIVGFILQYVVPAGNEKRFYLAQQSNCYNLEDVVIQTREDVILETQGGDTFLCEVLGKVFKDEETDNYIQQSLLFDPELFFFALLPPIIFYAGYSLQKRDFFRNLGSLLLYAFIGTCLSCFIVGGMMYGYAVSGLETSGSNIANLTGNPIPDSYTDSLIPSLLFGALISATDPVTILAIFHDLHVDIDLFSLVFGESVMNDAVAIVLFRSVDEYDTGGTGAAKGFEPSALFQAFGSFVGIFLGSFFIGCAMGLLTALLMKFSKLRDYPLLETSTFVIMSYSTFLFAEFIQLTGIVAVLFCGIVQSYYTFINLSEETRRRTKELFELINFLAENFVFSYMGLSLFTFNNHQWVPGFIMFSFVAIFAGRVVNIYILSFFLNLGRAKKISFRFQHMLVFAGLRGAIAFALAIRNTESPDRQLIFTTTLCIVMVTVFVCGGLTTLVLQCLKIQVGVEDDDEFSEEGKVIEYDKSKGNWFISKWSWLDKNYLIPIFTHHGRPLEEVCHQRLHICIPFCNRCKPEPEELSDSEELETESEEEEDESDKVISFRHPYSQDDVEEGDLGLGGDASDGRAGTGYQRGYTRLDDSTQESNL